MEAVIVICLLIVMVLLVEDRLRSVFGRRKRGRGKVSETVPMMSGFPDIVGKPKDTRRHSVTNKAPMDKIEFSGGPRDNFEPMIDGTQVYVDSEFPQEEPDEVGSEKQEEDDWSQAFGAGLATGVTFEHLSAYNPVIDAGDEALMATDDAVAPTDSDLLELLNGNMDSAMEKVAKLLDRRGKSEK